MSGSKGGKKEQKTTIDPRLTNALLNNNSQSQQVANNLGVRQFADFNNDQLAAFDAIRNSAGGWGWMSRPNTCRRRGRTRGTGLPWCRKRSSAACRRRATSSTSGIGGRRGPTRWAWRMTNSSPRAA